MPRANRINWPYYPHLVIARAIKSRKLFIDREDYHLYLASLRQMVKDQIINLYAFCLMPQELRLVLLPTKIKLSWIMQRLNLSHTLRINKKYNLLGSLFDGRFKSLVFLPEDLPTIVRSVHLWPLRVGKISHTHAYDFSSHKIYINSGNSDSDFLSHEKVLSYFGKDKLSQKRSFIKFVELLALEKDDLGIDETIKGFGGNWESYSQELKKWQKRSKSKKISLLKLSTQIALMLNIPPEQLKEKSRQQDIVMARRLLATIGILSAETSTTEIAAFLNRDKSQVSRLFTQGLDLLSYDEAFSQMFEALNKETI